MPRKSEATTGTLRRGSACLSCRRRKLRCDGTRPVCKPCTAMRREGECAYDDSARKSRTQTLRERLSSLQAKVRELEDAKGSGNNHLNPVEICQTQTDFAGEPIIYQPDSIPWDGQFPEPSISAPQSMILTEPLYSFGLDLQYESISSSSSDSLGLASLYNTTSQLQTQSIPMGSLPDQVAYSAVPLALNSIPNRWTPSTAVNISVELDAIFVQSFIRHCRQCCFYADTTRLQPFNAATVQVEPPSSALMSAVHLLGCFFTTMPHKEALESKLLAQTIHEVSNSLQTHDRLTDVVQALCLLAQYCFFNNREMEGNRHLLASKRLSTDLALHELSHMSIFELNPPALLTSWEHSCTIYWQQFLVERFWTAAFALGSAPSDPGFHKVKTPLPTLEGIDQAATIGNSPISALFDSTDFHAELLSPFALKTLAASIFDHSLRLYNSSNVDSSTWAFHSSIEIALKNLDRLTEPFTGRDINTFEIPDFNTELYTTRTLIVVAKIHLHRNNSMDLNISNCATQLVHFVEMLEDNDLPYLDPILAVCWASSIKVFYRLIQSNSGRSGVSTYTSAFLRQCIGVLTSTLHSIKGLLPLAGGLLSGLTQYEQMTMVNLPPPPLPLTSPSYSPQYQPPAAYQFDSATIDYRTTASQWTQPGITYF